MVEKLISFLPQFMVQLALVFCFAWDLPFCLFLQTVAFVALNKVYVGFSYTISYDSIKVRLTFEDLHFARRFHY